MSMAKPITAEFADPAHFFARVRITPDNECHEWIGRVTREGYGNVLRHGRSRQAHRVALVIAGVDVPVDAVVDHLCRNRRCVNPAHLEVTDVRTNTLRGSSPVGAAIRAIDSGFCRKGHDLKVAGFHKCGEGRTCAQCGRDRVAAYKLRKAS